MSVILLILKIVGIILLALLGFIIFLLLLVLFVPVRYAVAGKVEDEISVRAKVTWLLHLVSVGGAYEDGEFEVCLRICGIRLKKKAKAALDEEADDIDKDVSGFWEETEPESSKKPKDVPETKDSTAPRIAAEQQNSMVPKHVTEEKKTGIWQRIKAFFAGIKEKFLKIKAAILQGKDKISDIKSIVTDENNKIAAGCAFTELKYLLRHFKFRKIKTDLRFSLGDPANTGQALGVLCMIPALYRYDFHITPDFEAEKTYVRGCFQVKGHIRLIHTLVSIIRLWKQREVRVFVKKIIHR